MNTHELWQSALGELELKLSKAHFTTWFRNTFIIEYEADKVIIGVPNTFTKTWLEKKYHKDIIDALHKITENTTRNLIFRVENKHTEPTPVSIPDANFNLQQIKTTPSTGNIQFPSINPINNSAQQSAPIENEYYGFNTDEARVQQTYNNAINTNYTFANFIVGKQNELAHASAQAVASQPGDTYNPLFIYGGVGLGKTHLMHSVGNEIIANNPQARVLYVTCEQFTNDFINSVRYGQAKEFKDRYRNVDVLLIDDIQFISGKEQTQEEFFHTFNALHQANKQIMISSDRPPKSIAKLEKRLLSRLEWGMLVDVGAPDLETRVAILQIKCHKKNLDIPKEILYYIADTVESNVRELEGALNKIIAFHQFKNIEPTLDSCKELLQNYESAPIKKNLSSKSVIQTVAEYFEIRSEDLLGKSREKRLAFPRQIAMYLFREEMKSSYPAIGEEMGGRDHTTAMHAYTKILEQIKVDEKLKSDIHQIKQRLYSE
jgi:chromosomal replication initiator protein